MKTLRFLGMALIAVLVSVSFSACGSDDDESNTKVPPNAKGVSLWAHDYASEEYLWINEHVVINATSYNEAVDLNEMGRVNVPYYPFTMEIVYEFYSSLAGIEINESNFGNYASDFEIKYLKEHRNSYKYVYFDGSINLFNRISSVNY
ncbi:MAG: hypothetical protein IJR71_06930 [Prevotella sp.]|nr:hypothetical protein [Prevotella sp.]